MTVDRRKLLLGLAGLGLASPALVSPVRAAIQQPYQKLGVELYTVRQAFAADPRGTLQKIKAMGYDQVETNGYGGLTPAALKTLLGEIGLTVPAVHIGLDDWRTRPEAVLDEASVLGTNYVVLAWIPPEQRGDWKGLANNLNLWGEMASQRGLKFGYHNHDFEFAGHGHDMPFHVLLDETDPLLVAIELDCYWCSLAGHDPVHVIREHGDRIRVLHLKDKTAAGEMAPVGEGVIPFGDVLVQAKSAGVEYVFVEHDNPADPFASLAMSYKNLRG